MCRQVNRGQQTRLKLKVVRWEQQKWNQQAESDKIEVRWESLSTKLIKCFARWNYQKITDFKKENHYQKKRQPSTNLDFHITTLVSNTCLGLTVKYDVIMGRIQFFIALRLAALQYCGTLELCFGAMENCKVLKTEGIKESNAKWK